MLFLGIAKKRIVPFLSMQLNAWFVACFAPVQIIILSVFRFSSSFAFITYAPYSFALFNLYSFMSVAITFAPVNLASFIFNKPERPEPNIKTV